MLWKIFLLILETYFWILLFVEQVIKLFFIYAFNVELKKYITSLVDETRPVEALLRLFRASGYQSSLHSGDC